MDSPCYDRQTGTDCPKRKAGCATTCKAWAEYVRRRDEEYKKRYDVSCANAASYTVMSRSKENDARKKKKMARYGRN